LPSKPPPVPYNGGRSAQPSSGGRATTSIDPLGNKTTTTYDAAGN